MKKICMIATGGTIASAPGKDGLYPALTGERLLTMVPELGDFCEVDFQEILRLDSSNLLPEHWQLMACTVAENYKKYDGFVISHGTDTMAYSAGALYYMLKNSRKPIVFTGSQIPIEAPDTDAKRNLLTAFHAAAAGRPGVFLAFAGRLIWGNAAKKMYTEDFSAFLSINREEAGYFNGRKLIWKEPAGELPPCGSFRLEAAIDPEVCVVKLIPGLDPSFMCRIVDAGYHAIIIEGYGVGGVPTEASPKNFLPAIDYAVARGVIVVCATQSVYNGVHLDRYEVGILAARHGAISGGDLPIEALVPKLMLILAKTREPKEVRSLIEAAE